MKFGRVLAREGQPILPSFEIAFGECKAKQVVCPSCDEPVFKVQGQVREYLSHYVRKAASQECELRVQTIGAKLYPHLHVAYPSEADLEGHLQTFEQIVFEAESEQYRRDALREINRMRRRRKFCKRVTEARSFIRSSCLVSVQENFERRRPAPQPPIETITHVVRYLTSPISDRLLIFATCWGSLLQPEPRDMATIEIIGLTDNDFQKSWTFNAMNQRVLIKYLAHAVHYAAFDFVRLISWLTKQKEIEQ